MDVLQADSGVSMEPGEGAASSFPHYNSYQGIRTMSDPTGRSLTPVGTENIPEDIPVVGEVVEAGRAVPELLIGWKGEDYYESGYGSQGALPPASEGG